MEEILLYRPYKDNKWLVCFPFSIGFLLILCGTLLCVFWINLLSIPMFLIALLLYIDYSVVIALGQNKIQIFESKVKKEYKWLNFSYAYYGRNFKGFRYLILSNEAMNEGRVFNICNKCSISLRNIWNDNFLVIPIDPKSNTKLDQIVKTKVPNIQHFSHG